MTKKSIKLAIIFTCILTVLFVIQPKLAQVSAVTGDLLIFNQIAPNEEIFRNDVILFGGTIYNNDSDDTYVLLFLYIDLLDPDNESDWLTPSPFGPYSFQTLTFRNTLESFESRTFLFEDTVDNEVPIGENFTMRMQIEYINEEFLGNEQYRPNLKSVGDNVTNLNISVRRVDAPNYIYIVFVLLLLGIIAFIVVGLVGWIRARRNK